MNDANDATDPQLRARLASRLVAKLGDHEGFLAWAFARYLAAERITEDALAARFGIARESLDLMGICGQPRPQFFKEDVEAIADRFGVEPTRLANLLREVEVLEAFRPKPEVGATVLAAARDHVAEEPEAYDDGAVSRDLEADQDEDDDPSSEGRR